MGDFWRTPTRQYPAPGCASLFTSGQNYWLERLRYMAYRNMGENIGTSYGLSSLETQEIEAGKSH